MFFFSYKLTTANNKEPLINQNAKCLIYRNSFFSPKEPLESVLTKFVLEE